MSKSTQKIGNELFNNIFELQFGYKPLTKKSNGGLLKFKDVSDESFKTLQLMGYIPYIVNEFENNPNPSFVNAVRVKGTAKETSCGSLRTIYKRIGFIDSKNGKMIKGKNYDKFLTTKWDWFETFGTKVLVKGNTYKVSELSWIDYTQRGVNDYVSVIPKHIQSKIDKMNDKINEIRESYKNLLVTIK
jgi:hypothetical protein